MVTRRLRAMPRRRKRRSCKRRDGLYVELAKGDLFMGIYFNDLALSVSFGVVSLAFRCCS